MQQRFFEDHEVPVAFSFEGWKAELRDLFDKEEATQWDIGDLLLSAEDLGGLGEQEDWTSSEAKKFRREAIRITKKTWGTLKNFKSICRKFPKHPKDGSPSLRSDKVSFGVFRLVAPFSREHQENLLQIAQRETERGNPLTVNGMRVLIERQQKWNGLPQTGQPKKDLWEWQKVTVYVSHENYAYLKIAARIKNLPPQQAGDQEADFLFWAAFAYIKEHKELLAEIRAEKRKDDAKIVAKEAASAAKSEEYGRALAKMDEDMGNDVENKIPSY
jgi:hypothetical protein